MKKKPIIILSVIPVLVLSFIFAAIHFNNIFSPDDYGKKYEKLWKSKDGNISFIMDNKKGYYGHNCGYAADFLNNNPDCSGMECTLGFDPIFTLHVSGAEVLVGDSEYNPITQIIKVKIINIGTDERYDTPYKTPYKVGDIIEFEQAE